MFTEFKQKNVPELKKGKPFDKNPDEIKIKLKKMSHKISGIKFKMIL